RTIRGPDPPVPTPHAPARCARVLSRSAICLVLGRLTSPGGYEAWPNGGTNAAPINPGLSSGADDGATDGVGATKAGDAACSRAPEASAIAGGDWFGPPRGEAAHGLAMATAISATRRAA